MSTFDPTMNHRNDNAVAAESVDGDADAGGRHTRPPAEAETEAESFDSAGQEPNLGALNEVTHPFDQTNGIVEEVDRHHGETHHNDEQLDADPDPDAQGDSADDDEPGRESPSDRRPLVNTTLIAEEIFGDDEEKKARFD
jgi:hypothetical protein